MPRRFDVTTRRLEVTAERLDVTSGRFDVMLGRCDVTLGRFDETRGQCDETSGRCHETAGKIGVTADRREVIGAPKNRVVGANDGTRRECEHVGRDKNVTRLADEPTRSPDRVTRHREDAIGRAG